MRTAALALLRAGLLAGPTVLAFFSGGYFDRGRSWALLAAAALVLLAALAAPSPLPRTARARLVLAGAVGLAAWTALSATWAPVTGRALGDAARVALYAAALAAGAAAWRPRTAARLVEPAVTLGATVAVGYGVVGRLLPRLVHPDVQASAAGRLDQPLTYWNATGALAAIGLVLCARLAGDPERRVAVRAAAAAAAAPLAVGLYLTFSRGALAACVAGLVALLALAPTRRQLLGTALVVAASALAIVPIALSPGVREMAGSAAQRQDDGVIVLLALATIAAAAAGAAARLGRRPATGAPSAVPPALRWAAVPAIALLLLGPIVVGGGGETAPPATGATAERFASVGSNRYAYWHVALRAAADRPLLGTGASGFQQAWLRERDRDEVVRDAHSLEIETLAELGVVGLLLLGLLLGGLAAAAAVALRADAALAAGPAAGLVVWAFHAAIDWDWEMPALTLAALTLGGVLLAQADSAGRRGARRRVSSRA